MLITVLVAALAAVSATQNVTQQNITVQKDPGLLSEPLTFGPTPELVHLYYDLWPTGIAVSRSGRMFSNYPRALDPENLAYTLAELFPNNTERAYPSVEYNNPPQGLVDNSTYPAVATGTPDHLTGVQSVVIDGADRMWVLDTGRLATANGTILNASPGGAKLIGIDLETDELFTTIVFDPMAAPADSYLNDVRVDLNPGLTESGQGVAYITDSSPEGRNAIVIVDLGTGEAWRRLVLADAVQANAGFVPTIWGEPLYLNETNGNPINNINFGADGIALSADGKTLFFATTGGRELWSCPTALLRDRSPGAEIRARAGIQYHGETGFKDGMDTDTNNIVYAGNLEDNSISMFDPATGFLSTLVRDPRFAWTDAVYVGFDGYLYFTENQLWRRPAHWGGVERRQPPYSVFRVPLPNGGSKVEQQAPRARR